MTGRVAIALGAALALLACETTRKGIKADCQSDRDCSYGLTCQGAAVGQPGPRQCVYEQYSSCRSKADCYLGRDCRDGHCEVQCVADKDCNSLFPDAGSDDGPKCMTGECQRTEKPERVCFAPTDCQPDQDCVASRCVTHVEGPAK